MENIPAEFIDAVAQTCHEANRAYCHSLGDDSLVAWKDTPENIRNSAIDGVRFVLDNPEAPASASHDNWLKFKAADGWKYGEVKDAEAKTHPAFVSYDQLPDFQKTKDTIFRSIVLGMIECYRNNP